MSYRIEFSRPARRGFANFHPDIQRRIDPAILSLAENPRPPGCLKLSSPESLYRIRVGDYRIVYQIQDAVLLVLLVLVGRIAHRREVYR